MNRNLLLLFIVFFSVTACRKENKHDSGKETADQLKAAPDGFDYVTTKKLEINVRLLTYENKPMKGVLVSFYQPSNVIKGAELTKVMSDHNGYVKTSLNVPASLDTIVVDPTYFGLPRAVKLYSTENKVTGILGGQTGASGNVVVEKLSTVRSKNKLSAGKIVVPGPGRTVYAYDASKYDNLGRPLPSNLYPIDNVNWTDLLTKINKSLPESQYVKAKYITTQAPSNLTITALSDVWITMVHEGANYRNSFGYYTYTGMRPPTADDIDTVHIIFPNASTTLYGHGNMQMGDKVKIGRFPAGTSIGFVLLQDAYKDGYFKTSGAKFYTDEQYNPEDVTLKRHNVLLNNISQKTFLIGFEDINRSPGRGSDQDFNDLVVYAQSNPVTAISPKDIPFLEENITDTDGDGVPDDQDKYPNDEKRAYDRYYPSELVWGTLAFEDLWPNEGDYDLNDLVVSYRYKFAMSSANGVVDLTTEFLPLAAGATMNNGFGLQLPLTPSAVTSVTGYDLSAGYINLAPNGLESGQSKAVAIAFDNHRSVFGNLDGAINTTQNGPTINGRLVTLSFLFSTPLPDDFTVTAPFNPFMISNLNRGREIHLVNHAPTSLAHANLFKLGADDSNPGTGRYYLTEQNRPFALDIYGPFNYPTERSHIAHAYLNFAEWALSGGTRYKNWYDTTIESNVNKSLLYEKK